MAPGRPGRVPVLVALLKRTKRPMHIREIAALLRDNGDVNVTHSQIGATLAAVVRRKPDIGVRRGKMGYYVYNPQADVPVTATRNRSDELPRRESARVQEIREERERANRVHAESAIAETERNVATDAAHNAYTATLEKLRNGLNRVGDYAESDIAFSQAALNESARVRKDDILVSADSSAAIPAGFPFTKVHIHARLRDGRVLFTDDSSGRAWVAKEI